MKVRGKSTQHSAAQTTNSPEHRGATLWKRMAIGSSSPADTPPLLTPTAGLSSALAVLDLGMIGSDPGRRAVPSAGANYPYECYVVARNEAGTAGLYRVDSGRRICQLARSGTEVTDALCETGLTVPDDGAIIVVSTRPWLSMRKYGDRGYLYTQVDAAHLAVNLALAAGCLGGSSALRPRPSGLNRLIEAYGACSEVHSAVSITTTAGRAEPSGWVVRDGRAGEEGGPASRQPHWLERACWESLGVDEDPPQDAGRSATAPPPLAGRDALTAAEPRVSDTTLRERRSATGFVPGAISAQALYAMLESAGAMLDVVLAERTDLAMTLLVRNVPEFDPGRSCPAGIRALEATKLSRQDVECAFMSQAHLADSSAILLFHAPTALLNRGDDSSDLRSVLFRAGAFGQLMYLSATEHRLAITGVGGFDSSRWKRLADLPDDHDVVYTVALGVEAPAAPKLDKLQAAYAQNEAS